MTYDIPMSHEIFMRRCLELAEQGRGRVGNGALVGSVLVRAGKIIAEGFHAGFGMPHAERDLLTKFGGEIQSTDVLYVNLEPCCHHGKTPPCTDILFERGIRTVVVGMLDPDVRVAGQGIALLRDSGVEVIGPVLRAQCEWLNRGFISIRTNGRPWITLKKAQMADGSIAKPDGSPLKITSQDQDTWSHTWLRARHDAILVGEGTVKKDNPSLDIRFLENKKSDQINHLRIVLDKNCSTSIESKIIQNSSHNTLVVVSPDAPEANQNFLRERGVRVVTIPLSNGIFEWSSLWSILPSPTDTFPGLTSILVEGGQRVWDTFKQAGMVDAEILLTHR